MLLPARALPLLLAGLPALLLGTPARAQVNITCDQAQVTSRVPCVLTVAHADGKPRTWRWSVVGLADAAQLLDPIAPDRVRVKTPVTLTERTFTVVAEDSRDPAVTGTFVLRITPNPKSGSGERALAEGIFPQAFTPSLLPFKDHPEQFASPSDETVWQIAFCDDAVMGGLDRCWIIAGDHGLRAFKVAGDPVALPGFPYPQPSSRRCIAVAALPPGPGEVPTGAPRVVFCELQTANFPELGFEIYALAADGSRRFLAGGPGGCIKNGPGSSARFFSVRNLALDRRGNVYVGQNGGVIRKIGLDGQVSTLDLSLDRELGGSLRPSCFTVDPATGDLYASGFGRLVQFPPEGKAVLVIGGRGRALAGSHGPRLAPLAPGRLPLDTQFEMDLRQVEVHGRELILVTQRDGIYAFHLDSRRLARILPFDEHLAANRLGPVPYLNPRVPADRCAAIIGCQALALTKEAMGMVAMGRGLAELELPDGPITTVMDPPGYPADLRVPAGDAGQVEHKGPPAGAPVLDNLWPGSALETLAVRPDGKAGVTHWRSAAPHQRFGGYCWVEARGLTAGWAQISLLFVDKDGNTLGHSHPAGAAMPDVVSAPAQGRTLLRLAGTAPPGTDRVALCIRVAKGNPGATVSFRSATFNLVP